MTSLEGWSSTIELRPQRPNQRAAVTGSVPSPARRHVQADRIAVARRAAVTCAGTAPTRFRHDHEWAGSATMMSVQAVGGTLIGAPALPVAVEIGVTLLEHIT
jgi:hypothetical protein